MDDARPLVVTLALDDVAQQWFDVLRSRYFPTGRTQVGAHLTLFHALPGALRDEVRRDLAGVAGTTPVLPLGIGEPVALGRGVAYPLRSSALDVLHENLRRRWLAHLTRQDAQPLRAHVTVQNKADREVARATLVRLRAAPVPGAPPPGAAEGTGLDLHRYDGGPWTLLERYPFAGKVVATRS
jgi:hypothetical protein